MLAKIWTPFWSVVILASIVALPFSFTVSMEILLGAGIVLWCVLMPLALLYRLLRFIRFQR
jgi:hypothetical protein